MLSNIEGKKFVLNDLTFFTNEEGKTLVDRFNKILKNNTQYFDVLVGYFRSSGFYNLYEALEEIEKIRILVGINVDKKTVQLIDETGYKQIELKISKNELVESIRKNIKDEYEESDDTKEVEEGALKFIEYIKTGKLEIRIYPDEKIHAKVYIMRKNQEISEDFGKVITGSSNFSQSGLKGNLEFNVELKDSRDVKYALEKFNELWEKGIDITKEYEKTISDTWIREDITPYQLYLKFLYEFFKEEINHDKEFLIKNRELPEGFVEFQYQREAVIDAKKKLEAYNGVFISDVVGLGKTYICAMLSQQLYGRKLIVCPPPLVEYWKKTFVEFNQAATVVSLGRLDSILENDTTRYDYIFVDEAHRFRNDNTQNYKKLHEICHGKKVILISATPLNNYPKDIASQLYLFQKRTSSNLPIKNIEKFFRQINSRLKRYEKGTEEHLAQLKIVSEEIREEILQHVMVRRTRRDILENYSNDVEKQGLKFPELDTPRKLVYEFDNKTDEIFNETLRGIKSLKYARYAPLTYLINPTKAQKSLMVGQMNLEGFMRSMLGKRLESSFYAFKKTLKRFLESYERFIRMYEDGVVWISKKNINDFIDSEDEESLLNLYEEEKAQRFSRDEFKEEFYENLIRDRTILKMLDRKWEKIKSDPKLNKFLTELIIDESLKNNKIIIFTEAAETASYLYENLKNIYKDTVIQYSSKSSSSVRKRIEENFDPKYKKHKDDIKILITTDVLAEGVNLHRANVVINYDLPWNPTKVMQRVGRINRVGSNFENIYVYNFFPTTQGENAINLESNIISKLQAFHNTLGDDIKYLSDDEEINSFRLYKILNDKESLEGKDEGRSWLKYLTLIRGIRDKEPELFKKIKELPKKSRSSKKATTIDTEKTITFFKYGLLRKIYITANEKAKELNFFQAVDLIESTKEEKNIKINKIFYEQMNNNKRAFSWDMEINDNTEDLVELTGNSLRFVKKIKSLYKEACFTDIDIMYLEKVYEALMQGTIVRGKINQIYKKIEGKKPVEILNTIEQELPSTYLQVTRDDKEDEINQKEVILSLFLSRGEVIK